jgi:aspartyl aminopeptidase
MSKKEDNKQNQHYYEKKSGWEEMDRETVLTHAASYKEFLSLCKTERESVDYFIEQAEKVGFLPFRAEDYKKGYKYYFNNRGKGLILGVVGEESLLSGFSLLGAHVDAPRLDLKAQPLYEDDGMALFKTHYYGGIKKYQWLSIPLAIHGVIVLESGESKRIVLGEADDEPVFTIADLLPHLAKDQMLKPMHKAVEGEGLNVLLGAIPCDDKDEKSRIKSNVMNILHARFGIKEEDLISAELEVVPSGRARDVGLDGAFIGGYGQDDRVCAYAAVEALLTAGELKYSSLVLLSDKEEIGSNGNTGAQGRFLEYSVAMMAQAEGLQGLSIMGSIMDKSKALSADVSAAVDPNYKNLFDQYNAPELGKGLLLTKYTGSGGKYEANDASAEYMGEIRGIFNAGGVIWQAGELGKIDQGGGGTIAMYLSQLGIETVDSGPALLGMHSPFEIADKTDIYNTYLGYKVFIERS